ncbi:MAG: hypothetical protein EA423_12140 [Phycisphaerales bacterium]|nr:MAG: hypothetical protein EA423_12140 [Phycisphaerales bacterium]
MQQTGPAINRRRHERFMLPPMYSRLRVRRLDDPDFRYAGHIYDVSEGGVRFELDDPIEPGTPVAVEIALPGLGDPDTGDIGPGRSVFAIGNVIWVNEEDLPGPVRMAVAFTRYARTGDHERLIGHLGRGHYARAA